MGVIVKSFVLVAVCVVLCNAQPVNQAPVLREQPGEILFRESGNDREVSLNCVLESAAKSVKYTWQKNGQLFNPKSNKDIIQRDAEGTLVFRNPKSGDEGQYQCFAESDFGVASSRVINFKRTFLNPPKVLRQEHNPVEGRPFKLDCPVPEGYPKPTVFWKRQSLSKPSETKEIMDKRITLSPEGTLWFSNVTQNDVSAESKYVCLAHSPAVDSEVPVAEHIIKGLVDDKMPKDSELVKQYVSNDMTAKVGDITLIYCIYGSTPLAHPDWFKDGKNVNNEPSDRVTRYNRSAGKRLLIKETLLEDEGQYTCTVDNEVGKSQKHSMRLTIVSAPVFSKKPEKQMNVKQGQDVTIPCQATAKPAAKITWTHNAKPLVQNNRVVLSDSGLTLKGVQKEDKGYYGCRAINEYGDEYAEALVTVA